jgi:hypothetical protein
VGMRHSPDSYVTSAAALRLEQSGVPTIDLRPIFSQVLARRPSARLLQDDSHLAFGGFVVVRELLEEQDQSFRKPLALAGDCTVEGIAWCHLDTVSGKITERWRPTRDFDLIYRESGSQQIGPTLALLGDGYWKDHERVVWVLHEHYLQKSNPPRPFPPLQLNEPSLPAEQTPHRAVTLACSRFDSNIPRTSPYPNALIAHLYEDLDTGHRFLGIHWLMRERKLEDGCFMKQGDRLLLKGVDWNAVQQTQKSLARMQLVNEFSDLTLPLMWVEQWSKEWSGSTQPR